jgi:hypothetical protein
MRFARPGLSFDYPESWSVDVEDDADGQTAVTVYAPEGGFWSVSTHAAGTDPDSLSRAVLDQMRQEYRDLDSEAAADDVAGRPLSGYDLNFYCLDLTNTAQVRSLALPSATYVFFCQAEDRDWDRISHVFAAMTTSLLRALPAASAPGTEG